MLEINLYNIEELVFLNKNLQRELPEFTHLFNQWRLAQLSPSLRTLAKRTLLELMDSFNESHVSTLSKHFGEPVTLSKMSHNIVKNYTGCLDCAELELESFEGFEQFCVSREDDQIYLSFWR